MFYLEDGRQELFQWDIDVAVIVENENITEVHFANRRMSTALVCKVENGKAYIPNILLQEHLDIRMFAWDKNYTKYEKIFVVNKRPKPENYIYTETQLYSVQQIAEEVVEKALEEYDVEVQEIVKNFLKDYEDIVTEEELAEKIQLALETIDNIKNGTANGSIQSDTSTLNGAGEGATARGAVSVGTATSATANEAFAEGAENKATANRAHAAGNKTHARHTNSYTGGFSTLSSASNQMTIGQFNAPDSEALFIVGNGTDENNRSNALAVHKDGTIIGNLGRKLYRHWINVYLVPFGIPGRDASCSVYLEYISSDANPITTYADVINRLPSNNRSNFSPASYFYEYDNDDGRRVLYRVSMYSSSMDLEYYTSFGAPPTTAYFEIDAQYISVNDTVTEV